MKSICIPLIAATVWLCSCAEKKTETPVAETPAPAAVETPEVKDLPDSVKMQNWQAYMTPGDMHALMASWEGKWVDSMTMWMAPGAPLKCMLQILKSNRSWAAGTARPHTVAT